MRRDEPPAVGDERVEARHLQRRHQQVLLPDRELNRVARLPETINLALVGLPAPRRRRQQAGALGREVDTGRLSEAEAARPCLQTRAAPGGDAVETGTE